MTEKAFEQSHRFMLINQQTICSAAYFLHIWVCCPSIWNHTFRAYPDDSFPHSLPGTCTLNCGGGGGGGRSRKFGSFTIQQVFLKNAIAMWMYSFLHSMNGKRTGTSWSTTCMGWLLCLWWHDFVAKNLFVNFEDSLSLRDYENMYKLLPIWDLDCCWLFYHGRHCGSGMHTIVGI